MAYTPVLNDVLQVTLVIQNAEQVALPRVNYLVTGVGGAGGVTQGQIASFYSSGFSAFLLPTMMPDSIFKGAICQRIFPTPRIALEISTTGSGPGTAAGTQTLPRQTALVIKLTTALAGRNKRGRFYMPFPVANANGAGGIPTAAYITAINTIVPLLFTPQTVTVGAQNTTLAPVLFARVPPGTTLITNSFAEQKWGTIRRRGSFGRPNVSPI